MASLDVVIRGLGLQKTEWTRSCSYRLSSTYGGTDYDGSDAGCLQQRQAMIGASDGHDRAATA